MVSPEVGDNATNDRAGNFGNFAEELGCSTLQAADYANEIDDALGAVGFPRVADKNDTDGTNQNGTDITAPHQAIFPATAASILRSKASTEARQIVSFAQPLDHLLGGGFALSELTEIVGLPGTGKTQLAMQLCVDTRIPKEQGGVEGCAVVIDAEGSWSGGDRLFSMAVALADHMSVSAQRKKMAMPTITPESILEGIHIFRVHDEASQTCTLHNLPKFLLEQEEKKTPVKLVVIDSLAFHYRVASSSSSSGSVKNSNSNTNNNSLSTTHNLTRMAAFLTELASEFDLAVVAMNHLTTRIEKDANNNAVGGTKLVPALGESWAHSVTSRLMIDHYRQFHNTTDASSSPSTGAHNMDEARVCTLVKSPHKPTGTALFVITDKGIRGPPKRLESQSQPAKRTKLN